MTLKTGLVKLLIDDATVFALVRDRVFVNSAPQNERKPYVVIENSETEGFPDLGGDTNILKKSTTIITSYSRNAGTTEQLASAVESLVADYKGIVPTDGCFIHAVVQLGDSDEFEIPESDSEIGVFGQAQTYDIFWIP